MRCVDLATEKRFNLVGSYLYDGEKCVSHFNDPNHREEIVKLLNELDTANEILIKHNKRLHNDLRKINQITGEHLI